MSIRRERGVAEASGYVPVVIDRLKLIGLLIEAEEDEDVQLARDIHLVLQDSRHLQNEDAWRRMVDVLGERFRLHELESRNG